MRQSIPLEDNVPRVQPTPSSIDYEVAPQSNLLQYVDHGGYKTELGAEVEVSMFSPVVCRQVSDWFRGHESVHIRMRPLLLEGHLMRDLPSFKKHSGAYFRVSIAPLQRYV